MGVRVSLGEQSVKSGDVIKLTEKSKDKVPDKVNIKENIICTACDGVCLGAAELEMVSQIEETVIVKFFNAFLK